MTRTAIDILARLRDLRAQDAPTHGGTLLSYVYDPGMRELDDLAVQAMTMTLPVNGLDPTMFPSVPAMERDLIAFAKRMLGAGSSRAVFGTITSGGTESCLLAVKTARDLWRRTHGNGTPTLVIAQTAHAAFHKAAAYFGLTLDVVPVSADGVVRAEDVCARLTPDVALVVVSAPSYPTGQLDPVMEVAEVARRLDISCHVDACFGGFALPFWGAAMPVWDMRVRGVTSVSADLHKFGYAPKGTSVLLQRTRERSRAQYFATKRWPGYPVVNPTLLGSRSATSLAAAWSITQYLGTSGYRDLIARAEHATEVITRAVSFIPGLRVMGTPTGPGVALATDMSVAPQTRVDPHHLADHLARSGFLLQPQPGFTQDNGVRIPASVHLTITPVTADHVDALVRSITASADSVRGTPPAAPRAALAVLRMLGLMRPSATLSASGASLMLRLMGMGGSRGGLPARMAPLMRLIEELPVGVAEPILTEVVASLTDVR